MFDIIEYCHICGLPMRRRHKCPKRVINAIEGANKCAKRLDDEEDTYTGERKKSYNHRIKMGNFIHNLDNERNNDLQTQGKMDSGDCG